ncbi:PadR family transcriptional regulator [Aeromicrobium chenweiae]|uniref:Transcriptional regulator n=1 Tax=Aeromicrobium chenweiae TaxID=2079793 RepID=A0A2S0WPP7_9ACTN|nr:PadR family transcriptional regulator [Aeromicrobium chenweiae]AWB93272.1 transcriptional regulator [Aeromicrobium chenweiae]TGN34265.1 PadR family transcriptional regulator [Aeromicrobium chenweiae]
MALKPLCVSVLALLVERPMHPYEMHRVLLERREDRFVKIRLGSLYHTVERLCDELLLEAVGTEREGNRPERTTYAITPAGREAVDARVRELISRPVREYPHFPLALSEAHNISASEAAADLRQYVAALDDDIDELRALLRAARERGTPETYWVAGDYLLTTAVAQRDWITTLIHRIETKDLIWQPDLP